MSATALIGGARRGSVRHSGKEVLKRDLGLEMSLCAHFTAKKHKQFVVFLPREKPFVTNQPLTRAGLSVRKR